MILWVFFINPRLDSTKLFTKAPVFATDSQKGQRFPKRQILDSSKIKEFADDKFKFDETDGEFPKRAENTIGKGEIARHEQFLLFPQCFQKTCTADA